MFCCSSFITSKLVPINQRFKVEKDGARQKPSIILWRLFHYRSDSCFLMHLMREKRSTQQQSQSQATCPNSNLPLSLLYTPRNCKQKKVRISARTPEPHQRERALATAATIWNNGAHGTRMTMGSNGFWGWMHTPACFILDSSHAHAARELPPAVRMCRICNDLDDCKPIEIGGWRR